MHLNVPSYRKAAHKWGRTWRLLPRVGRARFLNESSDFSETLSPLIRGEGDSGYLMRLTGIMWRTHTLQGSLEEPCCYFCHDHPRCQHQGEEWKLSWSMTGLDSLLLMKRASQAGWAPKTWQHLGSCHSEAEQGGWKQRRGKPAPPPPSWKAQFNFWVSAPNFPTGLV